MVPFAGEKVSFDQAVVLWVGTPLTVDSGIRSVKKRLRPDVVDVAWPPTEVPTEMRPPGNADAVTVA